MPRCSIKPPEISRAKDCSSTSVGTCHVAFLAKLSKSWEALSPLNVSSVPRGGGPNPTRPQTKRNGKVSRLLVKFRN